MFAVAAVVFVIVGRYCCCHDLQPAIASISAVCHPLCHCELRLLSPLLFWQCSHACHWCFRSVCLCCCHCSLWDIVQGSCLGHYQRIELGKGTLWALTSSIQVKTFRVNSEYPKAFLVGRITPAACLTLPGDQCQRIDISSASWSSLGSGDEPNFQVSGETAPCTW